MILVGGVNIPTVLNHWLSPGDYHLLGYSGQYIGIKVHL